MGGTACPERGRAGRERPAGSLCRPGPRCSGVGGCRCLSPGHPPQPGPARKSKGSSGRFLSEVGNANTGAHRTLPPSCFCSCQELLAVHVHRACPGGARGSPAVLWAASLGLWEVPPELLTELLQLPWNTEGWLEVSSGSFQRLRWFAPLSPAKFCLRGADTLPFPRWDPEGTTLGPRGRRRAALLCPLPAAPWLCREPPAALRPAVAFPEREFPGARRSAPRAVRPPSPRKPRCRAALREWGIFPVESGVNSRT